MEFLALGPVEVYEGEQRLTLGGPKQRSVLALLMANAGRPVPIGTIIEGAYGEETPERVHRSIHTFISNLRSALGEVIERHGDSYVLTADRSRLDVLRFEDLVAEAADEDDPARAGELLREALELWRGHPFADIDGHGLLAPEITRLNELRISAIEARVDADLESGRDRELLAELESLTSEHPLHERFQAQQMLALYRAGRQGDALRAFERARTYLVEELGLDPSPELRHLEQRILEQDASLILESRPKVKRVAILVADMGDPDALARLDPDERHRVLSSQAATIDHAVESSAGRVIAQRGSAVYASFDDAVAAARTAADVQRSTAATEPRLRFAIAAGDVEVTGGDGIAGPPISRAAALVALAHGGQVLVSSDAHDAMVASGAPGLVMGSLGSQEITGLTEGELVYQLHLDGDRDFPPLRIHELPPPLPIPERGLPGYELRDEIGAGAFGVVHRAYQPTVGREVAIKIVRPEYANQPEFIRRFEVDAQLVARLEHPHIAPLQDYWREPDGAFLVMRWMRGGTLADRLSRAPLDLDEVDDLVRHLGSALDHAHRHGVAHRDLRPSNVLFDEDGNAYLADFVIGASGGDQRGSIASDVVEFARLVERCLADKARVDAVLTTGTGGTGYPTVASFLEAWREAIGSSAESIAYTPTRNPYKGLRSFGESDGDDFFARDEETARLITAVGHHRLVAVVGPSGVGKSSVVRAGLIPAVRRGRLAGSAEWLVTEMRPGPYPFEELASALLRVASKQPTALEDDLRRDERGLIRAVNRFLPQEADLLLAIDQFEELFTMVDDSERDAFLHLIHAVATDPRSTVRIVVTIRADFFDRPLRFGEFGDLLHDATVPIASPTAADLREMVVRPAAGVGVTVETRLADRIVADVEDQPGALPLLEFALTELFEERTSDRLGLDAYQTTHGVLGALGRRAEGIYGDLSNLERDAARQVFLRLVNLKESDRPTRRRVRRSELERLGIDVGIVATVLEEFGNSRLLTFDRDATTRGATVEVAHEALIGEWARFAEWVEDVREDLLVRGRLATAVADWEDSDRDDAFLLSAGRLVHHDAWSGETQLSLTTTERLFLDESRRVDDMGRTRRRRIRGLVTAGFAVAAVVAAFLALKADRAAVEAEHQAMIARANELAASARLQISEDPERAMMLALEAIEVGQQTGMDLSYVSGALRAAMREDRVLARHDGALFADVHPLGEVFLTGDGNRAVIRDIESGEPLAWFDGPSGSEAVWGGFIGDGSQLVVAFDSAGDGHTWRLWRIDDPTEPTYEVAYQEDVQSWMDWGGERVVEKWCHSRDECHVRIRHAGTFDHIIDEFQTRYGGLAVDRSGRWLADISDDELAIDLHDLDTGRVRRFVVPAIPEWVSFSPDGDRLAFVNSEASGVWVIEALTGRVLLEATTDRPHAVAWTEDGLELVVTGNAAIPEVIGADSGEVRLRLQGQQGVLWDAAAMVPDANLMLTGGDSNHDVVIWDIGTAGLGARRLTVETGLEAIRILGYVPEGDGMVVAGRGPAPALVFDTSGDERLRIEGVAEHYSEMTSGIYGGRYLAWVAGDGTGVVADVETGEIVYRAPTGYQVADVTPDLSLALLGTYEQGSPPTDPHLVDIASGDTVAEFDVDRFCIVRFSPDAQLALFYDCGTSGRFFDLRTGAELLKARYEGLAGIFLPDGRTGVTVGLTGELVFVDVAKLRAGDSFAEATIREIDAHDAFPTSLATNADGSAVVSAARGEPTRVWDVATGALVAEFPYTLDAAANASPETALHPTLSHVLVTSAGGQLVEYTWDLEELVAQAEEQLSRGMTFRECETYLRRTDCSAYASSSRR